MLTGSKVCLYSNNNNRLSFKLETAEVIIVLRYCSMAFNVLFTVLQTRAPWLRGHLQKTYRKEGTILNSVTFWLQHHSPSNLCDESAWTLIVCSDTQVHKVWNICPEVFPQPYGPGMIHRILRNTRRPSTAPGFPDKLVQDVPSNVIFQILTTSF